MFEYVQNGAAMKTLVRKEKTPLTLTGLLMEGING
jgi:hypothetical protein